MAQYRPNQSLVDDYFYVLRWWTLEARVEGEEINEQ